MSLHTKVSIQKMKSFKTGLALLIVVLLNQLTVHAQKIISEGSLVYNISIQTGSKEPNMADMLDGATTTIYIKGNQTRSEMVSGLGSESTIHDARTGTGVILKDYSGQKLMITLTKDDWEKKNKKYEGISYELSNETANIAGYNCKKAIAKLPEQQQRVFVLARSERLTYLEIGEAMGISPLTVKTHMSRALDAIKKYFADNGIILSAFVILVLS